MLDSGVPDLLVSVVEEACPGRMAFQGMVVPGINGSHRPTEGEAEGTIHTVHQDSLPRI